MQTYASASVERERPDQLYARRPGDKIGVFANKIAKVLGSKNSDEYHARPKDGNVNSLWQVLAREKNIAIEVGFDYIQPGGCEGRVIGMSPEEMRHSAINNLFKDKPNGFNFHPDRIFEIKDGEGTQNLEVKAWEAYLSLSPTDRKNYPVEGEYNPKEGIKQKALGYLKRIMGTINYILPLRIRKKPKPSQQSSSSSF